jgi:hypothetical protein
MSKIGEFGYEDCEDRKHGALARAVVNDKCGAYEGEKLCELPMSRGEYIENGMLHYDREYHPPMCVMSPDVWYECEGCGECVRDCE